MAIGKRRKGRQQELFVAASEIRVLGNPFYRALDKLLEEHGFRRFCGRDVPRVLCGEAGPAEHSARGVFSDADGGVSGRDRLRARDCVGGARTRFRCVSSWDTGWRRTRRSIPACRRRGSG